MPAKKSLAFSLATNIVSDIGDWAHDENDAANGSMDASLLSVGDHDSHDVRRLTDESTVYDTVRVRYGRRREEIISPVSAAAHRKTLRRFVLGDGNVEGEFPDVSPMKFQDADPSMRKRVPVLAPARIDIMTVITRDVSEETTAAISKGVPRKPSRMERATSMTSPLIPGMPHSVLSSIPMHYGISGEEQEDASEQRLEEERIEHENHRVDYRDTAQRTRLLSVRSPMQSVSMLSIDRDRVRDALHFEGTVDGRRQARTVLVADMVPTYRTLLERKQQADQGVEDLAAERRSDETQRLAELRVELRHVKNSTSLMQAKTKTAPKSRPHASFVAFPNEPGRATPSRYGGASSAISTIANTSVASTVASVKATGLPDPKRWATYNTTNLSGLQHFAAEKEQIASTMDMSPPRIASLPRTHDVVVATTAAAHVENRVLRKTVVYQHGGVGNTKGSVAMVALLEAEKKLRQQIVLASNDELRRCMLLPLNAFTQCVAPYVELCQAHHREFGERHDVNTTVRGNASDLRGGGGLSAISTGFVAVTQLSPAAKLIQAVQDMGERERQLLGEDLRATVATVRETMGRRGSRIQMLAESSISSRVSSQALAAQPDGAGVPIMGMCGFGSQTNTDSSESRSDSRSDRSSDSSGSGRSAESIVIAADGDGVDAAVLISGDDNGASTVSTSVDVDRDDIVTYAAGDFSQSAPHSEHGGDDGAPAAADLTRVFSTFRAFGGPSRDATPSAVSLGTPQHAAVSATIHAHDIDAFVLSPMNTAPAGSAAAAAKSHAASQVISPNNGAGRDTAALYGLRDLRASPQFQQPASRGTAVVVEPPGRAAWAKTKSVVKRDAKHQLEERVRDSKRAVERAYIGVLRCITLQCGDDGEVTLR
jgi:hypothetical protein